MSNNDIKLLQKINFDLINRVDKTKEFVLYIHIPFCSNKCDYCGFRETYDINRWRDNS